MVDGIDCALDCTDLAAAIKAAGKAFVARYYRSKASKYKPLTSKEAKAVCQTGLQIVTVFEGKSDNLDHFSHNSGVDDGTSAYRQALLAGQPPTSPIYFAVDFDCSNAGIAGSVNDYFDGIAAGYSAIAKGGSPAYAIGVYGSGNTCSWLLKHGKASFAWLAMSTGWGGYATFADWNLKQGPATASLAFDHDTDEAKANFGGFAV
jgi:hypothetical protein